MPRPSKRTRIASSDLDHFANEVTMAVWNRIAELPEFHHLKPRDYAGLFETIQRVLKQYHE